MPGWLRSESAAGFDRNRWLQSSECAEFIKHICVEGWDYIGQWTGVPLRAFLERVGADLHAKYVAFKTTDDYPSSIDMATALHPQTLLATSYADDTLADPFGYPLRLRMSTKLGYTPAQLRQLPTYSPGTAVPLSPDAIIKVGLAKPSH